jgi:hypothetical protein
MMRFTAKNVALGSAVTLGMFTITVSETIFLLVIGFGVVIGVAAPPAGPATSIDYSGAATSQALDPVDWFSSILAIVIIVIIIVVCVAGVTLLAITVFGPISALAGLVLRHLTAWPIHMLVYFVLGAIAAACVVLIAVRSTVSRSFG